MIDGMLPAYQVLPEVIVELALSKNEGQHITSKQLNGPGAGMAARLGCGRCLHGS